MTSGPARLDSDIKIFEISPKSITFSSSEFIKKNCYPVEQENVLAPVFEEEMLFIQKQV